MRYCDDEHDGVGYPYYDVLMILSSFLVQTG